MTISLQIFHHIFISKQENREIIKNIPIFLAWLIIKGSFLYKNFCSRNTQATSSTFLFAFSFYCCKPFERIVQKSFKDCGEQFLLHQPRKKSFNLLFADKKNTFQQQKVKKKKVSILFQQATPWQSFYSIYKIKWVLTFQNEIISSCVERIIFTFWGKKELSHFKTGK